MKSVDQYQIGFGQVLDEEEFEFHFTALEEVEDGPDRSNIFKMVFREDLISVMKDCGGIPEPSMDSYVKTIVERNQLGSELVQSKEEIAQAQEENN